MRGYAEPDHDSSYDVNRTYFPTLFRDDVDRFEDIPGKECQFVSSGYDHPDYSVLSEEKVDYYLWWRQCADFGELIAVDPGYAWLRVTELINSKRDPEHTLSKLLSLIKACSKSGRLKHIGPKLAVDYAFVHSLSLDLIPWEDPFTGNESIAAWNATGYPARFRPEFLLTKTAERMVRESDIGREQMREIVSMSLEGIDTICRSNGISLLGSMGYSMDYVQRLPYEGYLCFDKTGLVTVPRLDLTEGGFSAMVDSISMTAARLAGCQTSVSRSFLPEYRKSVAAAYDCVINSEGWNLQWFRLGEDFFSERDTEDFVDSYPRIIEQTGADNTVPDIRRDDVMAHWNDTGPVLPYTPSGMRKASFDRLDYARWNYYLGWREEARNGRFSSTDEGYIWLYCVESVLVDDNPERIQSNLEAMYRAFEARSYAPLSLITAAFDHAILHGYDPPPITGRRLDWQLLIKLESKPIGRLSMMLGNAYSFYDPSRYVLAEPQLYDHAFTLAVRAVDSHMLKSEGYRLTDLARSMRSREEETLYRGMLVHGKDVKKLSRVFVREQSKLSDIMEVVLKTTLATVNVRMDLSGPKIPKGYDTIVDLVVETVSRCMDDYDSRMRREFIEREASRITIDPKAISSAEKDLDAVRVMMTIEEFDESEKIEHEEALTGWAAFFESLDEVERNYLESVLSGGQDVLSGTGLRTVTVEASINEKAMECIGDAVMEDGIVFEDYADDIREAI